jgi:MFS family permease
MSRPAIATRAAGALAPAVADDYRPPVRTSAAYRGVLGIHDARALIGASAASQLGDWLFNAALLGYVYSATGSAGWVGASTICRLLPYVLLGPVGGMIADRYDRRTVLLVGDLLRCSLMLALAAVVATEGPVELVIALTALASAAGTAERPAAMAMLPRMVGESRLAPANALLHTVQDLGVVVGPAIGAILLAVAPDAVAFLVNGATFAASAALISTMRRRAAPVGVRRTESMRSELMHGLHTARTTPFVVPLFVVVAMAELTYGAQTVQLVLYAASRLDAGPAGYGYLLAVAGLGGLLSATVNPRLAASTKVAGIVVVAGAVFCATQLAYAWTTELAIALLVTLLGGGAFVACEVVAETTLARVVRSEVLGRVMGVFDALSVAAMVLGAVLAPLLIARTSLRTSFVVLGIATVAVTFVCLAGLRRLGELSRKRADLLASRLAVIERLPITVGAPRIVLEQLASASQICPLPPGVDVVVEHAPAHAFYAVIEGSVLVHRSGEEVARIGPGGSFGGRGLLDNAPRNATVTTEVQSTIMRIEGDVLLDALQSAPTVLSAIDRSNKAPWAGAPVVDQSAVIVDDPAWEQA